MKLHHVLATLLVAQCATSMALAASEFEVSPLLGRSTLSLDGPALKNGQSSEEDMPLAGVQLRYVSPIGLTAEVGHSLQSNDDWRDRDNTFRLSQYAAAIGWRFVTPHEFRITPKVGRARWDLYSKQGLLTHTQPGSNTRRGYDNFWELSVEKQINQSVALGILFKDNPYEFGNVKSIAFTASFSL